MNTANSSLQDSSLSNSWVTLQLEESQLIDTDMHSYTNEIASPIQRRVSLLQGDLENLLNDAAQTDSGSSGSSSIVRCSSSPERSSPAVSGPASPHSEMTKYTNYFNGVDNQQCNVDKTQLVYDPNTEWVWDWSSRPDNKPPPKTMFKRPKSQTLSMRNSSVMRHTFFSKEFLQIFIPSLIISNMIAFGLGVLMGKRLISTGKHT